MVTLYDYLPSGNGYKVALLLHQLDIPFEYVEVDANAGGTRTAEFLAINPIGKIPTVVLDDGTAIAESNASLWYFAEGTPLAGADRWERAQILQWMCFEQYSLEPNVATLRFWHFAKLLAQKRPEETLAKREAGDAALAVMDRHLSARSYFVAERFSIADIALFAYTHVADEGGFELARHPAVQRWIARVEGQPRFVPITRDFGVPASPPP